MNSHKPEQYEHLSRNAQVALLRTSSGSGCAITANYKSSPHYVEHLTTLDWLYGIYLML